ncbi:hypothetical protein ISN44_As11g027060 [Arabidopsis suecica]|uniref:Uncharacterized protein n=1 Tax=Arabidopsis suecica TaxID=45249 RepID=A0A8T1ZF38_ARASU|nr:hypothetical protein ISN44_As11g027060 [Arabidopsis suecica]
MLKTLELRSGYFLFVLNRRQTLCGILNLHGRGFHAREDPPVLLRFYTHHLRTLVFASSKVLRYVFISLKVFGLMLLNPSCESFVGGFGSLSNDHFPSNSSDDFKPYTLHTIPNCYVLPKLNSHYTEALANNFKHQSTSTFARTCQSTTSCSFSRAGEDHVFDSFINATPSLDYGQSFIH